MIKNSSSKTGKKKKWSAQVTKHSNALALEPGAFRFSDPLKIAQSLKKSAEKSKRKKGTSYQSAMSMLNFYINRGGKNLSANKKNILERAKEKLQEIFNHTKQE